MKEKQKISNWLRAKQTEIQKEYKELIGESNCNYGDSGKCTGVWIKSDCANCGKRFHTVFHIPHNDRCQDCKTLFYKKSRRYKGKIKANTSNKK